MCTAARPGRFNGGEPIDAFLWDRRPGARLSRSRPEHYRLGLTKFGGRAYVSDTERISGKRALYGGKKNK